MADDEMTAVEPAPPPQMQAVQLPLTTTVEHPGTLLMMMQVTIQIFFGVIAVHDFLVLQSPEQQITLAAVKSLLQFVKVSYRCDRVNIRLSQELVACSGWWRWRRAEANYHFKVSGHMVLALNLFRLL
jgi:hypothetical protein